MVYPASNEEAPLRTHTRHLELADRAKPEQDGEHDFFGVHEGRPFLTKIFPQMDVVQDIVIDYMHLVCEGKICHSN